MSPRPSLNRVKRIIFRVDQANADHLAAQARNERFKSATAYLNWLIAQDRTGRDQAFRDLEERIAATVQRLSKELQTTHTSVEANSAFLHAAVKMLLVNHPESDSATKKVATATAQGRYQKLLTNAANQLQEGRDNDGTTD